jgi:DNA-binding transcriptional LysR family regulator
MLNIHHLELFYYVARHGGIMEAVRRMPYGIQQPAISAQIIRLEEDLGLTLFQRRPFQLTKAGAELFEFVKPFFGNIDAIEQRLTGGAGMQIRIGASEVVQRDHLPDIVAKVRQRCPELKLYLREGYQPQLESWLLAREIDLAITMVEGQLPPGIKRERLIQLELALLVSKDHPLKSADELWKRDKINEPLIALPGSEGICRHFQRQLETRDLEWIASLEVSSLGLVEAYVAGGFGIGLGLHVPKIAPSPKVRLIPLKGFDPVDIGALWMGKRTSLMDRFVEECHARAAWMTT